MNASIPVRIPSGLKERWALWRHWVLANAVGELVGLGGAAAIGFMTVRIVGEPSTPAAVVGIALLMIALGAFEGFVVGVAQWHVIRNCFPTLARKSWVKATVLGALIAWTLGMIPSTVISLMGEATEQPATEPTLRTILLLAAAMGAVLGMILGFPQWLVIRHMAPRAGWWIAANAAAWMLGMPTIFLATALLSTETPPSVVAVAIATDLFLCGAVVGAVHGIALARLATATGNTSDSP